MQQTFQARQHSASGRRQRWLNVKEHACHAGLDPASMNSEPWIADQVRNDSLLSCVGVAWPP
ncbi:MAG: hypothetical protein WBI05_02980, partial [Rhodoferax sp.]|uniref:hypothetical protein n=1 Tax=Rhodoferax sp. TaxID=50421 RepID=UPI003C758FC3